MRRVISVAICVGLVAVNGAAHAASLKEYDATILQLQQAISSQPQPGKSTPRYDVMFRRDPMQPLIDAQGNVVSSAGMQDGLSVQGIIWSDVRPLVVVDGELYARGDMIGSYEVYEIHQAGVTVRNPRQTLFIPLDRGLEAPEASAPASSAPATP